MEDLLSLFDFRTTSPEPPQFPQPPQSPGEQLRAELGLHDQFLEDSEPLDSTEDLIQKLARSTPGELKIETGSPWAYDKTCRKLKANRPNTDIARWMFLSVKLSGVVRAPERSSEFARAYKTASP